jgi:hypothetical protein
MGPLGLSRSALADGFPMLDVTIFAQTTLLSAMNRGFRIVPAKWPRVNGHPAIASKAAQVFSYSLPHFMVSDYHIPPECILFCFLFRFTLNTPRA